MMQLMTPEWNMWQRRVPTDVDLGYKASASKPFVLLRNAVQEFVTV